MTLPLVSILVVCRNQAATAPRAANSIVVQDYAGPTEVIVQDGGSTDGTLEILQKYALAKPLRFKQPWEIVSEPDRSALDGWHRAVRRANGKYIALCWTDDELDRDFVRNGVDLMQRSPAVAYHGDSRLCDEDGHLLKYHKHRQSSLREVFFYDRVPHGGSSFFDADEMRALEPYWRDDNDEWCLWVRLFMAGPVRYSPRLVSSATRAVPGKFVPICRSYDVVGAVNRVCEDPAFPLRHLRCQAISAHYLWLARLCITATGDCQFGTELFRRSQAVYRDRARAAQFLHFLSGFSPVAMIAEQPEMAPVFGKYYDIGQHMALIREAEWRIGWLWFIYWPAIKAKVRTWTWYKRFVKPLRQAYERRHVLPARECGND